MRRMQLQWPLVQRPSDHFGALLLNLREDRGMTVLAVVAAMRARGYPLSPRVYTRMEEGRLLPSDGEEFIDAYRDAISLTDEEVLLVVRWLARDRLRRELGGMGEDIGRLILC